jgi:hypothetical protein
MILLEFLKELHVDDSHFTVLKTRLCEYYFLRFAAGLQNDQVC